MIQFWYSIIPLRQVSVTLRRKRIRKKKKMGRRKLTQRFWVIEEAQGSKVVAEGARGLRLGWSHDKGIRHLQ